MTVPRQPVWSLASLAVGADVVFAVVLFGFLVVATDWPSSGDVVPRPVVLAILFAAPAAVGELGRRAHRRSLLLAAGLALVPESFLSFAGVTLPFLLPAALFLVAAVQLRGPRSGPARVAAGGLVTVLLVAAPVTVLVALTGSGCWSTATGEGCGTGLLTWPGLAAGAGCLVLAVGLAAAVAGSVASRGGGAGGRPYTPSHARPAEPTRSGE